MFQRWLCFAAYFFGARQGRVWLTGPKRCWEIHAQAHRCDFVGRRSWFDSINGCENSQVLRQALGYLPQKFGICQGVTSKVMLLFITDMEEIPSSSCCRDSGWAKLNRVNLFDVRKKRLESFQEVRSNALALPGP